MLIANGDAWWRSSNGDAWWRSSSGDAWSVSVWKALKHALNTKQQEHLDNLALGHC